jgi:uncharacterized protein YbcC (UPF0753/DUF2309 family)/formate hydrogenlyase subunit 3/multisubunit Na+/H+ antiporter MnhD subunit
MLKITATGTFLGLIAFVALSVSAFDRDLGVVYLDAASVVLGTFVLLMGWLVATYSATNLRGQRRQGRYAGLLTVAIVALWVMVVADPLVVTAAAWTISGLAIAGLVAHRDVPAARTAARRVAGRLLVADAALWAAVLILLTQGDASRSALTGAGWLPPLLIAAAGVVRSALVPAWRWLPLTAEAPSPVSALLHAGVVNGLGLIAILWWPLFAAAPGVLIALLVVGGVTAVLGTAAMRVRPDVKGKLAASTSAQMGYMTVQLGLGLPALAMLHVIGHGFYKAWHFLRAGGAPRRVPARSPRGVGFWRLLGLGTATVAVAALGVIGWPGIPVVDLVPLLVASATATLALVAVIAPERRVAALATTRGRSWSALVVLSGLFVYVSLMGIWSRVFEMPGVWSGSEAVAIVGVVITLGAIGMYAVSRDRLRAWAVPTVIDTATRVRGRVPRFAGHPEPDAALAIDAAAKLVGPMWPLHSAVAVNPLRGLQEMAFEDAAGIAGRAWGAQAYLPEEAYAHALEAGRFTQADLAAAAQGFSLPPEQIGEYLRRRVDWRPTGSAVFLAEQLLGGLSDARIIEVLPPVPTAPETWGEHAGVAERVSGLANTWTALANAGVPGPGELWSAFRRDVQDLGLRGLRRAVQDLPDDPRLAVGALLDGTVPRDEWVGYLSRLLARDPGWSAHLAGRDPGLVSDLLAIRLTFDVACAAARGHTVWSARSQGSPRDRAIAEVAAVVDLLGVSDAERALALARELRAPARQAVWQRAWEQRYRNRLIDRVATRAAQPADSTPVPVQAVFCIDVRSERLRRHLEAAGDVETFGFAGFFGLPIRHETVSGTVSDQCPVLISPSFVITEDDRCHSSHTGLPEALRGALVGASAAPATPFAVAEGLGALAGADAVMQTVAPRAWDRLRAGLVRPARGQLHVGRLGLPGTQQADMQWGMSVAQRTAAAAGMLRALGLVEQHSPLLLIVGHAARVENNAFAAAYDCGACGGSSGYVNARVMAAILNDSRVRRRLAADHGIHLPSSTAAVPALHNTTTDEVQIDPRDVPTSHADLVGDLRRWVQVARRACAAERELDLPGRAGVHRRAADWAEPQPEWGLAGNAAFVIGPRRMTKGLNLRGRVFLHSYEPGLDVDGSILELLLTAPMVVTQWINNQYYFATVDPERFGAGDKTTHNVVGDYGVVSGAGGDLRVGLPWQAVYAEQPGSGALPAHEPLRLHVVVYADPAEIRQVLESHREVADLVANEWIALAAIDPRTGEAWGLGRDLQWRPWLGEPVGTDVQDAQRRDQHADR